MTENPKSKQRFPVGLRNHFFTCEGDDCSQCAEYVIYCKNNNRGRFD